MPLEEVALPKQAEVLQKINDLNEELRMMKFYLQDGHVMLVCDVITTLVQAEAFAVQCLPWYQSVVVHGLEQLKPLLA